MSKETPIENLTELLSNASILEKSNEKDATLKSISDYILNQDIQNIIVMSGAGISTSAGIPDFRSPGTGLYDNLQKYNLPYPEAIFDMNYFIKKPDPFFELAREMMEQSKIKPTLTHYFIKLLHDKGKLKRNYTQNIDTLERATGLHHDKIVEAHGSFHTASCIGISKKSYDEEDEGDVQDSDSEHTFPPVSFIGCGRKYDKEWLQSKLKESFIPTCEDCDGIVKPDITFFGENLPKRFFELCRTDFDKCDLLVILGTSLKVYPFAGLVHAVPKHVPRLIINNERPSLFDYEELEETEEIQSTQETQDLKESKETSKKHHRDTFYLGSCDDGCFALVKLLGWEKDLQTLIDDK